MAKKQNKKVISMSKAQKGDSKKVAAKKRALQKRSLERIKTIRKNFDIKNRIKPKDFHLMDDYVKNFGVGYNKKDSARAKKLLGSSVSALDAYHIHSGEISHLLEDIIQESKQNLIIAQFINDRMRAKKISKKDRLKRWAQAASETRKKDNEVMKKRIAKVRKQKEAKAKKGDK